MANDLIARASTRIDASAYDVWRALTDPKLVKQYFFGTDLKTDWKPGGAIRWSGEWQGKAYEDKGKVLEVQPGKRLRYTHFSPLSGLPDEPANYQTITVDLAADGGGTRVSIEQDGNPDEKARDHSQDNWKMVLEGLKKLLEQ